VTAPRKNVSAGSSGISPQVVVPIPTWCAGGGVWGTRTEVCDIEGATLTTYQVTNGVQTVTGELQMDLFNYSYTAVDLPNWAHQLGVASYAGYGPALGASVSGAAVASGSCSPTGSTFPSQPLSPFNTMRSGESQFTTTATAIGAVGFCATTWNLVLTVPGHTPAALSTTLDEVRCDNAVGANGFRPARVGCVVPWYASAVSYSQSLYPSLASHVARAQASGLPGNSFAAPLYRTTNNLIINANRNAACGGAPSIAGLSCDEYPLASTYNGLAFGGTLRTFTGCNISAPAGAGPTGASACMITATENSAQGGLMAAFYYNERVLDPDPFRVAVTA